MRDSYCNGDNVSPAGHIALTIQGATHRNDRAVCFQADGVRVSCCKRFSYSNCVPQCEAALPCVLILSKLFKRHGCFYIFSLCQKLLRLCIFLRICRFYTHSIRILVIAQCCKCRDCAVIIARSQQFSRLEILHSRNDDVYSD